MRRGLAAVLVAAATLAACGGGGLATVRGTVSGLTAGTAVTLQLNGGQTVVVASSSFEFPDTINAERNYTVTVSAQPLRGYCTVDNPTGIVDRNGSDVNDIHVTCVPASIVGVTVNGLPSGASVTLQNASDIRTETVTVAGTGSQVVFNFPTSLPSGHTYAVTVTTPPTGQTCSVTGGQNGNGTGTMGASDVAVVVSCT